MAIHATGDVSYGGDSGTVARTSPVIYGDQGSGYQSSGYQAPPLWQVAPPPPPEPRRQGAPVGLAFGAGIATTLLVIIVLIALLARHARVASASTPVGQTVATSTAQTAHHTPVPGATATPIPVIGTTPAATMTPAPTPSPASTPPADSPALSVQPKTDFSFVLCTNQSFTFDVVNTGQNSLSFSLDNKTTFRVDPMNGSLDGNERQTISVSRIKGIGNSTIVVNAPGATNQPITVTIHCTT